MERLAGKVALVTGGSRGIGRAICAAYLREGARVATCARSSESLEEASAELSELGEVLALQRDLVHRDQVSALVEEIMERFGRIDVLVNNAGILGPRVPIVEYPESDWEEVLRADLSSVFWLLKEVLPVMAHQGGGSVINVTSGVAYRGKACWGAYSVAKFGVEALTQLVAAEMAGAGIRSNSVNPGGTRTAMRRAAYPEEDPETLPAPKELAPVFVYLASDESRELTGQVFHAWDFLKDHPPPAG